MSDNLSGNGEWPTMPLMKMLGGDVNQEWHAAINRYSSECIECPKWMYNAMHAAQEVPRIRDRNASHDVL